MIGWLIGFCLYGNYLLAEARHMHYCPSVGGRVSFANFFLRLALFYDKPMTGETLHSAELLFSVVMHLNDEDAIAKSVDPDQIAPSGAVSSESALSAKTHLSQYLEYLW